MLKIIPSIFLGCVAAILSIVAVQFLSNALYPMPENLNFEDPTVIAEITKNMPLAQFWLILFGYALGSFVGGLVATRMHPEGGKSTTIVVAIILLLLGIMNMLTIPHPTWFWFVSCSIYIPFALLGSFIYIKIKK
jgi:CBS-domain-containing membrane protein